MSKHFRVSLEDMSDMACINGETNQLISTFTTVLKCRNFPHASKNISILPLAGQKKVKEKTASGIPPDKGFLSAENNSMNSTW